MKKYKLSDLCDVFGRIGFRGYTVNDLVAKGEGAITFSPSDINNFTLSYDNCTYISLYKYEESPEIKVFNGNIIFTKTGSSIGKTAYVENLTEKATINPQFVVLKNFKCNGKYLFYILTSKWFQKSVWNIVVGSTVPTMSQEDFKKREVYLPERHIQDQVASALSTLDKRIENLRAQNRVLEQTAKTIYDYTFLQCAGHQTTYNKTLNRNIPAGWEVKKLSEIANITMGQSPEGSSYNEIGNGKIFYQGCTDFGVMFPTPRLYTTAPTRFAKVNDILMSVRAPVGTLNIANTECCIGRGLAALNAKEGSNVFLYYVMKNFENHFKNAFSMGTTFGSITKNDLYDLPVLFPDSKTLELFSMQVSPLFKKQLVNSQQIETLTTQRNTLLPLLM
ncbi:MAG: restriction endonuclease subunit S, partial [Bacteroidales bacterium]|nr:restriction endonuclease subunit S [Bacteroidales bacterium]